MEGMMGFGSSFQFYSLLFLAPVLLSYIFYLEIHRYTQVSREEHHEKIDILSKNQRYIRQVPAQQGQTANVQQPGAPAPVERQENQPANSTGP